MRNSFLVFSRKKALTAGAIFFLFANIHAQPFKLGIKGGPAFSYTTSRYATGSGPGTGLSPSMEGRGGKFNAGIVAEIGLRSSKQFAFQTGLQYSGKGGGYRDQGDKMTIQYLEMPIMAVIRKNTEKKSYFIWGGGIYLAYALSGSYRDVTTPVLKRYPISFGGASNQFKKWDAGLVATGGFEFSQTYFITAFYHKGLINSDNTPGVTKRMHFLGLNLGIFLIHR